MFSQPVLGLLRQQRAAEFDLQGRVSFVLSLVVIEPVLEALDMGERVLQIVVRVVDQQRARDDGDHQTGSTFDAKAPHRARDRVRLEVPSWAGV